MTIHSHLSGLFRCVLGAFLVLTSVSVAAAQAEFHYQYGKLTNPFSSVREYTSILTVQHATSWRLGDSYLFVDILDDGGHDGFNDKNLYGEWYPTLSFSKLGGSEIRLGPLRDIAIIGGINFDGDANVLKYLPGVRASWGVPGFAFLNTDFTAFIDASSGVQGGGAPRTSNSFMFDVSWALPVQLGSQSFLFGGHGRVHWGDERRVRQPGQGLDSRAASIHLGPGRGIWSSKSTTGGSGVPILAEQAWHGRRR